MTTTTAITYVDGKWVDANAPLWSSMSHGVWLSSMIFDGARAFEGVTPDLDLHCQRAVRSAGALGLRATMGAKEIEEIARDGVAQFSSDTALYIRPMFWAEVGFVAPDPDSTKLPAPGAPSYGLDDSGQARNWAKRPSNSSQIVSVGPFRCFATINSARFSCSVSLL